MIPSFFVITEGMSCLLAAAGVKVFPSSFHGLLLQIILKGFEQQVPTMGCDVEAETISCAVFLVSVVLQGILDKVMGSALLEADPLQGI